MDTDEKIGLAEALTKDLIGVERTEWNKCVEYFRNKNDLGKLLDLAKLLSSSLMLRERPQRTYQKIYEVLSKRRNLLENMATVDVLETFGYVSRTLIGNLSKPIGGMLRETEPKAKKGKPYRKRRT